MMLPSRRIRFFLLLSLLAAATSDAQTAPPQPDKQSPVATSQNPSPTFAEPRRLMEQGRFDDAITDLQRLAAQNSPPKGVSHELGVAYYKKGDYPKAIESLRKAMTEDPADNEAVQLLGLSYYLTGRPA